jgi:hypothetical protein
MKEKRGETRMWRGDIGEQERHGRNEQTLLEARPASASTTQSGSSSADMASSPSSNGAVAGAATVSA